MIDWGELLRHRCGRIASIEWVTPPDHGTATVSTQSYRVVRFCTRWRWHRGACAHRRATS